MDFQLTEQQRRMVAAVRDLAQGEFKPNAQKYMDGTFPWENMRKLADIGVLGMSVPEEYGGLGLPVFDTALVLEEIAKTCYVTAMATLGEAGVQTRVIATYAPNVIRERILPKVVSGDCILAVCMTEPHAGTDVANYRTDAKPGREGIGCILLEPDTPGFEVTGTYHTMGGENLHEIQFNNCELPLENLVIRDGGFRKLLNAFNTQRCLNPSISLGLAEGAFDEARNYVRDRTVFGKAIGDYQGVRWKLAEMYREIETARSILYRACITANPFPDPFMAAVAKITCNEMSNRVTSEAIQLHGGFGFTDEFAVSRLYRAARYGTLGGGTSETLRDLIGKRIMDAAETGAELLAYDMNGADLAV